MFPVKLDPLGALDLLSGVLLLFTVSPIPENIAAIHAWFLIFKGTATVIRPVPLGGMPIYVLGGAADILSATILFLGTPPIFVDYKIWISGFLFLKGVWTMFFLMNM